MNLIPKEPNCLTYNYYCTFSSQGVWGVDKKIASIVEIRNRINSEFLFGKDGVLEAHDEIIRKDILVLLDDGWDVPPGIEHTEKNCGLFGSMIVDGEKFPEFAELNPYDRLKSLSEKIKSMGYAGLALWIPANHYGEEYGEAREKYMKDAEAFWTERAKMCAYADVKYLKVDWGYHGRDVEYRKIITDKMREFSPNTMIEHVIGIFDQPYDPSLEVQKGEAFLKFMELAKDTVKISDFYRTYDVLEELSEATTLMRIAKLIDIKAEADEEYKGIINVEDNPIIAAALGMTMGIMRHKNKPRYDDVVNSLIWQRIAPPFRFEPNDFKYSGELICDSYKFNANPNEWPYLGDEAIEQYAPAVMSANAPLAEVCCDEEYTPFVLNSRNKITDAYTVAVLEINKNNEKYIPLADISVCGASANAPVGFFGKVKTLAVNFDTGIEGARVYLQHMTEEEARNITDCAKIKGNTLIVSGEILNSRAAVIHIEI